jgi:uncharacterized protein
MRLPRLVAAVGWGASIGALGGLVGLGGAEFRLPVLLGVFRFRPLDAVILNKALSLVVVTAALVFRTRSVPLSVLITHWSIVADLLGGSLLGAWLGAGWALRLRGDTFHRIIAVLLVLIAVLLLIGHHATAQVSLAGPTGGEYVAGVAAGFGIGVVAALMGVAGGEFLIPTIVLLFGLDAKVAGSLSLAVSLPTMITGFVRYSKDPSFAVLKTNAALFQLMAVGSVLGALAGGLVLGIVPSQYLLPALALILVGCAFRVWQHAAAPTHAGSRDGVMFGFEPDDVRALTYIPLRFRMKLDLCAIHLSQRQWNALSLSVRRSLLGAPCHSAEEVEQLRQVVARAVLDAGGGSVRYLQELEPAWRGREVPTQVGQMLHSLHLPLIRSDTWQQMSDDKRFALFKLTRQGHARNLEAALREFGLLNRHA